MFLGEKDMIVVADFGSSGGGSASFFNFVEVKGTLSF